VLISTAGDYQFDVYRTMKEYNGNSWEGYQPFTNVMVGAVFPLLCVYAHPKPVASLPYTEAPTLKATEASYHKKEKYG
jgi:serine/threonine-protein kinase haspin